MKMLGGRRESRRGKSGTAGPARLSGGRNPGRTRGGWENRRRPSASSPRNQTRDPQSIPQRKMSRNGGQTPSPARIQAVDGCIGRMSLQQRIPPVARHARTSRWQIPVTRATATRGIPDSRSAAMPGAAKSGPRSVTRLCNTAAGPGKIRQRQQVTNGSNQLPTRRASPMRRRRSGTCPAFFFFPQRRKAGQLRLDCRRCDGCTKNCAQEQRV